MYIVCYIRQLNKGEQIQLIKKKTDKKERHSLLSDVWFTGYAQEYKLHCTCTLYSKSSDGNQQTEIGTRTYM